MLKNKIMKNIAVGGMLLFLAVGMLSCKKMLDVPSHRALTEENMWQTKNDARAGLSACYALMRAAMCNENAHWVYGDLRGGDFSRPNGATSKQWWKVI